MAQEPGRRQRFPGQLGPWLARGRQIWADLVVALRRQFPQLTPWSEGAIAALLGGILALLMGVALVVGGRSPVEAPAPAQAPAPAAVATGPESSAMSTSEPPPGDAIGSLQGELSAIAQRYGKGFLQSVQASLAQSRLILTLSPAWYGLDAFTQGALATDFQLRGQGLGFETLELRSPEGDLLARSPVVGTTMVILQSQAPPPRPPESPRYRLLLGDS